MRKVWVLALVTYRQYLRSGTFLILTFGIPLLMVIAGGIPLLSMLNEAVPRLGYVDLSQQLAAGSQVEIDGDVTPLTAYDTPAAARTALDQGQIDAFLVVPDGYFEGESPRFYALEAPGPNTNEVLSVFLREAMLADQPDWLAARLADPSRLTYVTPAASQQVAEGAGLLIYAATPAILALAFGLLVFTGAGQMGAAIVQEKEQRSMEMIITSLAPWQLVSGKVLGITLLSLAQFTIWLTGGAIALGLAFFAGSLSSVSINWQALTWAALLGIPGYFLYAALGAGLGVIAGDRQQARQLSALLGFVALGPMYLMGILINALNGPLAIGLTLFPLTAPIFALFRMTLIQVPAWQLLASLLILLASLVATVWAVGRIFRSALLMAGQAIRPKQLWRALRQT
jgi:ABC-2 type transport system permease protein